MNEMTTADHLPVVIAAWDSWFEDDGASQWDERLGAAVESARAHLAPVLVDMDAAPAPRCLP